MGLLQELQKFLPALPQAHEEVCDVSTVAHFRRELYQSGMGDHPAYPQGSAPSRFIAVEAEVDVGNGCKLYCPGKPKSARSTCGGHCGEALPFQHQPVKLPFADSDILRLAANLLPAIEFGVGARGGQHLRTA